MQYIKFYTHIWNDPKVRKLSTIAKLVWVYLCGNDQSNFIGLHILKLGTVADDLDISMEELTGHLQEILDLDMADWDEENRLIFIKNFLKYHPIGSQNQMKGVSSTLQTLPHSPLIKKFKQVLCDEIVIKKAGMNEKLIEVIDDFLEGKTEPPEEEDSHKPEEKTDTTDGTDTPPTKKIRVEDLVELWNQTCFPVLSQVMSIHDRRQRMIRVRMIERPDLKEWSEIFKKVIANPFLRGENDKGWRADFDWVLNPSNLAKVIEGKYDPKQTAAPQNKKPESTKDLWDFCKVCGKETLKTNTLEGYCQNCNPKKDEQMEKLQDLLKGIGKIMPDVKV